MKIIKYLFSSKGICTRKDFTISFIVHAIVLVIFNGISNTETIPMHIKNISLNTHLFYSILIFIPYFLLMTRRLHDTNTSGWWILIGSMLPPISTIILIIFLFRKSVFFQNKYITSNSPDNNKYFYKLYVPICLFLSLILGILYYFLP